jgi:hypothetical protein
MQGRASYRHLEVAWLSRPVGAERRRHESCALAAPKAARWRSRDLNGGGHQSCPGSIGALQLGVADHLPIYGVEQVGDRDRLVAGRTESTWTDAPAEAPALQAILISEITGLTGWTLVHGAWPRGSRWNRRQRSWVSAPPRCLAARRAAEALSTNPAEHPPAHNTGGRRSAIVTRPDLRLHAQPPAPPCSVAPPPCQTWPEPIGRCHQT